VRLDAVSPFLNMIPIGPLHSPHSHPAIKAHPETLIAVTAVFNPHRYLSRYRLYRSFAQRMAAANILLITVEIAMGARLFEITEAANPHHIQLFTTEAIWQKEAALNIGLARARQLFPEATKFAWIDADVSFARGDIANETLHKLEHSPVVQMFSQCSYLGPKETQLWMCESAAKSYETEKHPAGWTIKKYVKQGGHPGLGWAFTRDALDSMGGLFDMGIAGSGDMHMLGGWIGDPLLGAKENNLSEAYKQALYIWGRRADRVVQRNIGCVEGMAMHHWHGKSGERGYDRRWVILANHRFDPFRDILKDTQGLWQFSADKRGMALELSNSLGFRNEDSIDV